MLLGCSSFVLLLLLLLLLLRYKKCLKVLTLLRRLHNPQQNVNNVNLRRGSFFLANGRGMNEHFLPLSNDEVSNGVDILEGKVLSQCVAEGRPQQGEEAAVGSLEGARRAGIGDCGGGAFRCPTDHNRNVANNSSGFFFLLLLQGCAAIVF